MSKQEALIEKLDKEYFDSIYNKSLKKLNPMFIII